MYWKSSRNTAQNKPKKTVTFFLNQGNRYLGLNTYYEPRKRIIALTLDQTIITYLYGKKRFKIYLLLRNA
ncbi:Hypothetical protein I595_2024 [Croceitalea dokdonensis DOKDO 023]|uniref:Uncharacterized protein n=1 Tax=Croceitalea dokdonensis DOKDO 023 TaxID=1300341 RepID=A0A0P7B0T3_9FLAO|nr:Hypothetical protein I595_2024 [Croceitalea dokdonensis DOKDO 023]